MNVGNCFSNKFNVTYNDPNNCKSFMTTETCSSPQKCRWSDYDKSTVGNCAGGAIGCSSKDTLPAGATCNDTLYRIETRYRKGFNKS